MGNLNLLPSRILHKCNNIFSRLSKLNRPNNNPNNFNNSLNNFSNKPNNKCNLFNNISRYNIFPSNLHTIHNFHLRPSLSLLNSFKVNLFHSNIHRPYKFLNSNFIVHNLKSTGNSSIYRWYTQMNL